MRRLGRNLLKVRKQWYLGLLLLFAVPTYAEFSTNTHIDPLGLEYQTSLALDYGYSDNVLHQHESEIIGSDYVSLKPVLSIAGHRHTKDLYLFYQGDYREYNDEQVKEQSYDDHFFYGNFKWELSIRHHIEMSASYQIGHEALGDGVTKGFYFDSTPSSELRASFNDFNIEHEINNTHSNVAAKYTYGAKGAKGNLIFEVQQNQLDYDVLESYDLTFQNYMKNEEFTETRASIDFRHQITGRTRFDYVFMFKRYDYIDPERDNDEWIGLVSFISQLTGKSKVEARLYFLDNQLSQRDSKSINGSIWYKWQPVDYSTFILKYSSEAKEADNTGDYVQSKQSSLSWQHEFLGHVSTDISYKHINDEYQIKDNAEVYDYVDFSVKYLFRPHIELSLQYRYSLFNSENDVDPIYILGEQYARELGYRENDVSLSLKVGI